MEPTLPKKINILTITVIAIFIIVLFIFIFVRPLKKEEIQKNPTIVIPQATTSFVSSTSSTSRFKSPITSNNDKTVPTLSLYKDGNYFALGDYNSPGGAEEIKATINLKNDIIISATIESKASRPNSQKFQKIFIENFKPLIIGKNLDQVELHTVSGSSLTSGGWNDAIEKIKIQAKA